MAGKSGWREVTLESVASEITVGHVGPMMHEYVSEGIPFLRSKNVVAHGIDFEDIQYISPDFHRRLQKSSLAPGDVVIVRTGKPGATAVIPDNLPTANCSDLVIVRSGPHLNPHFLSYAINTIAAHHVSAHLVGAVQQHFNVGSARQLKLMLPPLDEQNAIVAVLKAFDDKFELTRRMNETLEAMARAIFQSWFVDFDPVRAKLEGRQPHGMDADTASLFPDHFAHVEGELVPTGWRLGKLSDLQANERYAITGGPFGSELTRTDYADTGTPVIRGQNLDSSSGWFNEQGFVFVSEAKAESLASCLARSGDVVFTQRGTLGQVALIPKSERYPQFLISQSQMKMTCAPAVPPEFIYLYFRQTSVVEYILANATASGVPHINLGFLRQFPILVPTDGVLRRFGELVAPIHARIVAGQRENAALTSLRDALLPKLLSGELRSV